MDEKTVAEIAAWATLAANAVAAAYAGWRWWQVRPSAAIWPLLRAAQAVAVAQALVAGVLFAVGYMPADGLYWLYAVLPIAIGLIAEQLRIAAAEQVLENRGLEDAQAVGDLNEDQQRSVVLAIVRREVGVVALAAGVVALAAGVVAFLALRAALIV